MIANQALGEAIFKKGGSNQIQYKEPKLTIQNDKIVQMKKKLASKIQATDKYKDIK